MIDDPYSRLAAAVQEWRMPLDRWFDIAAHARIPDARWPWDEVNERIDETERRELAAKLAGRSAMRTKETPDG